MDKSRSCAEVSSLQSSYICLKITHLYGAIVNDDGSGHGSGSVVMLKW